MAQSAYNKLRRAWASLSSQAKSYCGSSKDIHGRKVNVLPLENTVILNAGTEKCDVLKGPERPSRMFPVEVFDPVAVPLGELGCQYS